MRPPKTAPEGLGRRLERGAILVAAVGLHALVLFLLTRPAPLVFADRSNDEDAIDVTLDRSRRPARSTGGADAAARMRPVPARLPPSGVEPLPFQPEAVAQAGPAVGSAPAGAGSTGDLAAALRGGGFACGSERDARLSPEERARCQEKLGALARNARPLPATIDVEKRAYYAAVAEAYRNRGQMVPLTARGAGGMFATEDSIHLGHGPRAGCSWKFGPNADKAPKGPPNALRAGHCFIQPPVGSLTPEADLQKPY